MVITYKNNRNNIYYKTVYIHEELFFTTSRWFFFISTPCKVRNLTRILLHRKLSSLSRMSQISVSENLVIHVIYWRSCVWELIMHAMIHGLNWILSNSCLSYPGYRRISMKYVGDLVCENACHGYGGNPDVLGYKKE